MFKPFEKHMHVEYACLSRRVLIFHSFCSSLFVFQLGIRTDRGRGLLGKKWKVWIGGGRGLKTGKNVRTAFMDDS